jgi:hypothetical protein
MSNGSPYSEFASRVLSVLRNTVLVLHLLRVPILVTVAAGVVLALPEQTKEVYRSIAQDVLFIEGGIRAKIELGLAAAGLLAMGLAIWYVSAILGLRVKDRVPSGSRFVLIGLPPILVLLLFIAAAAGVYCAQTSEPSEEGRTVALEALQYRLDLATPGVAQRMLSALHLQ